MLLLFHLALVTQFYDQDDLNEEVLDRERQHGLLQQLPNKKKILKLKDKGRKNNNKKIKNNLNIIIRLESIQLIK